MKERYCPTPEITCEDCQDCFNEGESIALIKDPRNVALDIVYWYFFANGNIKKPEGVKEHPLWPIAGNASEIIKFVKNLVAP